MAGDNRAGGRLVAGNTIAAARNRVAREAAPKPYDHAAYLTKIFSPEWKAQQAAARTAEAREAVERAGELVRSNYVPRYKWAGRFINVRDLRREESPFNTVTLHHTGSKTTPRAVENLHRGGENLWRRPLELAGAPVQSYKNYGDSAYKYMVGKDGTIFGARSLEYIGTHVRGHNTGNIGVAALGDYTDKPMPEAQRKSIDTLVTYLKSLHGIDRVKTHGQFDRGKADELRGAQDQIRPLLKDGAGDQNYR